jgi:hypothetical protein
MKLLNTLDTITYSICIPKLEISVQENTVRVNINKTNIGEILSYKELSWKNDPTHKRILMYMRLNHEHHQYSTIKERLESGNAVHVVSYPTIYELYKYKPMYNK